MSRSNLDLFRASMQAFYRGDLESWLGYFSEGVVFIAARSAIEGPFLGHDGLRKFFADTAENFSVFEPTNVELRDLGDRVLALGTLRVRAREGDVETEIPIAGISTWKDGKCTRWEDFRERRLALEALGLES